MNPKENPSEEPFPKLELLPKFNEISDLTKSSISKATNTTERQESPASFKDFKLDWSIGEQEETQEQKNKRELEEKVDKKIEYILEQSVFFKEKYEKLSVKYNNNLLNLKIIFINIWIIGNSNLESRDRLVKDIFMYLETENLNGYLNYFNRLLSNEEKRENRLGFPKDVYTSLFALKNLFEKIFKNKIENTGNSSDDIWTQIGGGRIR